MKQKSLFTTTLFLITSIVFAQPNWTNQNTGIATTLHSIHFGDIYHGCAVGSDGKIITTNNSGKTWTAQISGVTDPLRGVCYTNSSNIIAVGENGKIISSSNNGVDWIQKNSGSVEDLQGVAFANDTIGWAIGLNGTIKYTSDGGNTWLSQTVSNPVNLFSISVINENTAFAVGYMGMVPSGKVVKTVDGGNTWTILNPGGMTLYGTHFINDQKGWAVGNTGTIIHTENGGDTWTSQTSPTTETLKDVHFINDSTGWIVGTNGTYLYTENSGLDWESVNTLHNINMNKIFFINEYRGWTCGNVGRVQYTRKSEEICLVTVDSLIGRNKVIWERILGQGTSYYNVYKYSIGNNYDSIGYVPFDNMSEFIDQSSTPATNSNRYKISAVDSMGNESDLSPYHETMNLQIGQGIPATTVLLSWSEYKDESGRFIPSAYSIFRGNTPENLGIHVNLPGINISYNDLNVTENMFYYISVVKSTPCYPTSSAKEVGGPYGSSFSNMEENTYIDDFVDFAIYQKINCYPNPMITFTQISIPNWEPCNKNSDAMVYVKDISGKTVQSYSLSQNSNSQFMMGLNGLQITLQRNNLKSGIYFIELTSSTNNDGKTYRGKLVVE